MLNTRLAGNYSWNGNEYNVLFRNDGQGHFDEVGFVSGSGMKEDSRSFVSSDLDGDGDLDFVTNSLGSAARFIENKRGSENHWLSIELQGTKSNRDAIGARVYIEHDGKKQWREFQSGYSYLSQGQGFRIYFGLGRSKKIDSLLVRWPSGQETSLKNVAVNRTLRIVEPK